MHCSQCSTRRAHADDEEGLPILEHSLQCADLLRVSHPGDIELQVAGLVHDLGWLERAGASWRLRPDAAHDVLGRALVRELLGDRVADLVGGHVAAKRYLLTTDAGYASLLSARSEVTLGFQGGVMDGDEVTRFERRAERENLVALRRADDAAKVRGQGRSRPRHLARRRRIGRHALSMRRLRVYEAPDRHMFGRRDGRAVRAAGRVRSLRAGRGRAGRRWSAPSRRQSHVASATAAASGVTSG